MNGLRIETVDENICVTIPRSFLEQLFGGPPTISSGKNPHSIRTTVPTLKSAYNQSTRDSPTCIHAGYLGMVAGITQLVWCSEEEVLCVGL